MENQDQNSLVSSGDPVVMPQDLDGVRQVPPDVNSLSAEPQALEPLVSQERRQGPMTRFFSVVRRLDVALGLLLLAGAAVTIFAMTRPEDPSTKTNSQADGFGTIQVPLEEIVSGKNLTISGSSNVTINGQLQLSDALYLAPQLQPTGAKAGQIYFDSGTNQLAYFNGQNFVFLTSPSVTPGDLQALTNSIQNLGRITSLNGVTGEVTLGNGLTLTGNQLNNTGVLSVQGLTGDIALTAGPGIVINGTSFSNSGILSVAAGSPNVTVANDGNGNVTIDIAALPGSGTVTSSGSATAGSIPLFTGPQNIENSIITQSGLTVTISGDLSVVTGGLTLSTALTVSNGGTGATSLPANGVLVGNGTAAVGSVVAGGAGLCLVSTAGAPVWAACPSAAAVTSLNGLTGALSIANASAAGSTITIDDASTTNKGIASFNGTNFTVTGGAVNTAQNIHSGATPTFVGVNTNTITPSAALTVGVSAQTALLQGSTTTITSNGAGNNIVLNSAATIELQDNTNVTGSLGISGDLAVNGGDLTSSGTLNITPGGALTIGSSSQALTLQGGATSTFRATSGANTTIIGFTSPTANTTLNFPALAAGTYTICTTSGNCSGAAATLQSVYDNSTNPEIVVDATRGALTIRDAATPLGANLLEVQNNTGSATYLAVTASGAAVTGTITASGNINSSVGALQTNGTTRIDNSGNLLNIAAITASGSATFQGGAATLGTNAQAGSVVLNDGSSNTGTLQVAALGQNTTYTLPDPGAGSATICLSTGNCAGTGGGVTTSGGTTNRLPKFNGAQSLTDSSITDDATNVAVSVDVIIQGGDLTVGTVAQRGSILLHDGNGQTTTLQASDSSGDLTFVLPANAGSANQCLKQSGVGNQLVWQDCDGGSGGSSATLQTAYNNSSNPEITLDATRGGLTIRDNSTPLGANLFEIQNNLGSTTYLAVTVSGLSVTGTATASGNINTTGGVIQTNSTTRIDNAGNMVNIGNITGSGAVTIASVGAGNDITIDGSNQFVVQDSAVFNSLATFNANIDLGASDIIGTTGDINLTNFDVAGVTGNVTAGTYNGQTISNAANFTGTVAIAGDTTLAGDIAVNGGDITSTTALNIIPGGALTVGISAQTALLQGSTTTITSNGAGNDIVLNSADTIELQDNTNVTGNISVGGTLGVTGNGTISGDLGVNGGDITSSGALNITPGGALTIGANNQALTLQGGATTTFRATSGANTTVVGFVNPTANTTLNFPALAAGTYTICTTSGNCSGAAATLQSVYENSNSPEIILDATRGALTLRDNATPLGANLLEVQNNAGSTTYLAVTASGVAVTGTATISGDINTSGGAIQTNGTTRIDNSGNLINIAGVTASGSATFQGGGLTLGTNSQSGSIVLYDGSSNTGTLQTAALGQNTTYTLPDPGAGSAIICLSTGNCAGSGGGVTTSGGTTNRLPKFTGAQAIGDSSISDDGTTVTLTTDAIIQGGDITLGTTSQLGSIVLHDGNGQTTTLSAGDSSGNLTFVLPTVAGLANQCLKQSGVANQLTWQDCDGGAGGSSATLQSAYDNSTNPELVVDASRGALTIRDNSTPLGANLFEVQNNAGSTTYFGVTSAGVSVTGTIAATGNINTTTGTIQTNSTTRIDNTGNLTNIGNISGTGAITIASSGAGNDIIINGADQFIVQDVAQFNAQTNFDLGSNGEVYITGTGTGANTRDYLIIDMVNNTSSGNQNGLFIQNAAGTGTTEALIYLDNADTDTAVAYGLQITTGAGTITTAIDVSDPQIGTALQFGANDIDGTNFDIAGGTGAVTAGTYNGQTISSAANFTGTVAVAGNTTLTGDIAVNGGDITSTGALNITPGGTLTVGASGQQLVLQGNAGTVLTATGSGFTTTVGFNGAPSGAVTYNFDRAAAAGTYTICTSVGNCSGVGGGVTTSGGTTGTLAKFTGAQTLGDSLLSESGATVTVNGNLNITSGNQFQVNGTQISSASLSNDANLAKLSASQTFTGNTVGFQNSTDSTNAFNVQNQLGARVLTVDTTGGQVVLGVGSTLDGKLVFSNVSNTNTVTILPGAPTGNRTLTLPDASGIICTDSGNCAGAGATLQTGYNFSAGGTVPKIKVNSTLLGVDIQDADTTIAANLFNVRASNAAGLGTVMFGVGNTGAVTLQNSSNSTTALRLLTQGGTAVLTGDTQNGQVLLGQSGTLAGTLVFRNASNSNTVTLTTAAPTTNRSITLPDAAGTVCLDSGNCAGAGGGVTTAGGTTNRLPVFNGAQTLANSWLLQNGSALELDSSRDLSILGGNFSVTGNITASGTYNGNTFNSTSLQFSGAGSATISSAASQALTLTSNAAATWSTTSGNLSIQAQGNLNLGNGGGQTINIGTNNAAHTITLGNQGATGAQNIVIGSRQNANSSVSIESGSSGTLNIGNDATAHTINIGAGGTAAQAVTIGSTSSTSATTIQGGSGNIVLQTSSGARVQVGSASTDATAVLFTLDSYNTTDPTGTNGSMYYSTSTNSFRCYQNGAWRNCVSTATDYIQNQNASQQSSANFWISGTGRADVALTTPRLDTATATGLSIGNTNATVIDLGNTSSNITTIANGQFAVRPVTDTTTVSRVLNSQGVAVMNVDTTTPNLITNSTFEGQGTTGWSAHGGGAAPTGSISAHYDNDGSLLVSPTAANHGARYNYALAASTQYSLSFFVRAAAADFSTLQIGYSNDGTTDSSCATGQTAHLGKWVRITCTFTTAGSVSGTRYVYIKQTDATSRSWYIDAVQLEAAAAPTPYRNGKIMLNNSVVINSGPLDAAASTAALQVRALSNGKGVVLQGSGENNIFSSILDVRSFDDAQSFLTVTETSRMTTIQGGSSFLNTPALQLNTIEAGANALKVVGTNSQTAAVAIFKSGTTPTGNLISLQDSADLTHGAFNNIGNQLSLGRVASSGTVSQGRIVLADGTTSNFGSTVQSATLTANRTITLPDATGTVCLQNSTSCGFASSLQTAYNLSSATDEIVLNSTNGTLAIRQDAGAAVTTLFEITNNVGGSPWLRVTNNGIFVTGTVNVANGTTIAATFRSALQTAASTSSDNVQFSSGQVSGATSNTGAVTLQSGNSTTSGNTGDVTITSGNATSGNSGNIAIDAGTATGTRGAITLGSANASSITLGRTSTNITTTVHGLVLFRTNSTNNANAFDIQDTAADSMFKVNTTNKLVSIGHESGTLNGANAALTFGDTCGTNNTSCAAIFEGADINDTVLGDSDVLQMQGGSGLRFSTGYSNTMAMVIDGSQRVGINTETPSEALTVQGNFNVRNSDGSKQYRFRTSGGSLDFETSGVGVPGELWMSGWTGANFTGTQVNFFRMNAGSRLIMVGTGSASDTPTILAVDRKTSSTDPGAFTGGMYYNDSLDKFRCYEDGGWKDCLGWTLITKTTTESITSDATLSTDATLQFPMEANTGYLIRCQVYFTTGATGDFKFAITAPTVDGVRTERRAIAPAATAYSNVGIDTAITGSQAVLSASAGSGSVSLESGWYNGGSAGTWGFQWAQNTSDATATSVTRGSYCEYKEH